MSTIQTKLNALEHLQRVGNSKQEAKLGFGKEIEFQAELSRLSDSLPHTPQPCRNSSTAFPQEFLDKEKVKEGRSHVLQSC